MIDYFKPLALQDGYFIVFKRSHVGKITRQLKTAAHRTLHEFAKTGRCLSLRAMLLPLRLFIRRDPAICVLIGRDNCQFNDNAKYFYCWLMGNANPDYHVYYMVTNPAIVSRLRELGGLTCSGRTLRSYFLLLRAGMVVIDTKSPVSMRLREWYRGALFVQLWHGIGLKTIEHGIRANTLGHLPQVVSKLIRWQSILANDFLKYDYFVSTSVFYTEKVFRPSVDARYFVNTGYPRHDYLVSADLDDNPLTYINIDNAVYPEATSKRSKGWRVILYAPTFRDNGLTVFDERVLDLDELEKYGKTHKILFLIKLHPIAKRLDLDGDYRSVRQIDHASDICPILKITDLLITDYSSISSDFLLLDRPIIFFPYDMERYMKESRVPMFDYDEMTPGPKCKTFAELMQLINTTLLEDGLDPWSNRRSELRALAFDNFDGNASKKLWNILTDTTAHRT